MALSNQTGSSVTAASANIGEYSKIVITTNSANAATHTLYCRFVGANMEPVETNIVTKTSLLNYNWLIPDEYYKELPDYDLTYATIYCETYDKQGRQIGSATSSTISIGVSKSITPSISVTAKDINQSTVNFTKDSSLLIKDKSTAEVTIEVTAYHHSTVERVIVNGVTIAKDEGETKSVGDSQVFTITLEHTAIYSEYVIDVMDSRGFISAFTYKPKYISYKSLSCVPSILRGASDKSELFLTVSGNYTNPSNSITNTITTSYKYRATSDEADKWVDGGRINQLTSGSGSCVLIYGSNTYTNAGVPVSIGNNFDEHKSYIVKLTIKDNLTQIEREVLVNRVTPIFDYGEEDFNFNVEVKINKENIFSLVYPVNSVYISTEDAIPPHLQNIGTWGKLSNSMSGTYAWKRIN